MLFVRLGLLSWIDALKPPVRARHCTLGFQVPSAGDDAVSVPALRPAPLSFNSCFQSKES